MSSLGGKNRGAKVFSLIKYGERFLKNGVVKKSKSKGLFKISAVFMMVLFSFVVIGCGNYAKDMEHEITVISREEGSGTRGAFVNLVGTTKKNSSGKNIDYTTLAADITNSTAVMLTGVEHNKNAIGYISFGSMKDTVKALKIDGVSLTPKNIADKKYRIVRNLSLVVKDDLTGVEKDFINFIFSKQGQNIITKYSYIPARKEPMEYKLKKQVGKIVIVGSSSVSPIIEKLAEAYKETHHDVEIELQTSDSTTGINSTLQGVADIGMSSRDLKDSEKSLKEIVVALDAIAVIVNKENLVDDMKLDDLKAIYMGDKTSWKEITK